jgi:UDP-N-acetylglucosamine diphosphorylase / glucose-1-phosphate thymidylyltransferase / UDP-N-acetylgalactosamine diphosphorylase / glucosamine-1-phosphate N-acetyltransferase / galactosamine-1-phosphate N-acetyltransferase
MKIVFVDINPFYNQYSDHKDFELDNEFPSNYSLSIFGKALISRNLHILNSLYNIEKIVIPKKSDFLMSVINENNSFDIEIEDINSEEILEVENFRPNDYEDKNLDVNLKDKSNSYLGIKSSENQNVILSNKKDTLYLPCNIIIEKNSTKENIGYRLFQYPWNFLENVMELLHAEVKDNVISKNASIAKSSIIDGPCIIEDDVVIDDFVKIKGPSYIGRNSYIGMGSLIRNSIIEKNTNIGFNCEVGKSYFAGNAKISHHNVILDSLIGKNVWFGGYSGTANVLLSRKNIRYSIDGKLIDIGKTHFGAVVSNNSSIGASVIILPGRTIPPNSVIQAGTIFQK